MNGLSFQRVGGIGAILAGIFGFLYAVAFVVLRSASLSALFLLLGGIVSVLAILAVYHRVRATDEAFASLAVVFALIGVFGAAIHGGYDLANVLNPPATIPPELAALPNQVDPRGLLTFGSTGIGIILMSWLIRRTATFSKQLGTLGYLLGTLLVIVYLARLIVLDPANPILLAPLLLTGFIVNPLWYVWLGRELLRVPRPMSHPHVSPQAAA